MKTTRRICGTLFAVAFIAFAAWYLLDYRLRDQIAAVGYTPTSELETIIERLDLTKDGHNILFATRPELQGAGDFNQSCPNLSAQTSTLGCFDGNRVYVFNINNTELDGVKEAVLAHELLHAVWHRLGTNAREELRPLLEQTYQAHSDELSEHMENYDASDRLDELHSVIGTQVAPTELDAKLREHYEQFFKQHSVVVSYYAAYSGVLNNLRQSAQALYDKTIAKKAELDQRTEAYKQASDQLSADIEAFNTRASQPNGGFETMSQFYQERDRLIVRQQELQAEYEAISELVDEVNQLIDEYNESVVHVSDLFNSMQSDIQAPQRSI